MKKTNRFRSFLFLTGTIVLFSHMYGQALQPGVIAGSQSVCLNATIAPFTSVSPATGGTGVISYLWEYTNDTTGSFSQIGVSTATLNVSNLNNNTFYFRRSAYTSVDGPVYSNIVTITRPLQPSVYIYTTPYSACTGQPYSFSTSASNAASYNWTGPNGFSSSNPSFTINNAQQVHLGGYTCVVTATSGCTASATHYISSIWAFAITPSIVYKCYGSSATFSTQQGSLGFTWTGPSGFIGYGSSAYIATVNNLSTGIYSVTAEFDNVPNSCFITATVNLLARPLPTVQLVPSSRIICTGENIPFVAFTSEGALNYYWSTSPLAAIQNPQIALTPSVTTSYTVIGEDAYGCRDTAQTTIFVGECTGVQESNLSTKEIQIYPNPSIGSFEIKYTEKITLRIINAMGQTINTIELNNDNNYSYNANDFSAGIYYIIPEDASSVGTRKFVVYK